MSVNKLDQSVIMLVLLFLTLLTTNVAQDDGGYTTSALIDGTVFKTENSVAIINSTVFDVYVAQSSKSWLISFTAPWCGHCKSLEPKFAAAARELKDHTCVGKVDATSEQALMARFPVQGYPTIFFISQNSVYRYNGVRSTSELVKFAKVGYKNAVALSATESPLGYVGVIKGKVISLGFLVQRAFRYLTDSNQKSYIPFHPFSMTSAVAILALGGLVGTALLGVFLAWLFMPKNINLQ